ncbi:unnamed protein product [Protopolystoma xenopodis]|uniref:Uncharacterized protein n=1 Tax=Protopolystoma xenopodis TaxID=117903 RepID=A0A448WMG2_9PLAT|nr:unnamed protein product [Protopolystoma xenopodis]
MGPPGLPPSSLEAFTSVRPTRPNSSIPNPLTTSSTSSLASLSSPNSASTSANVSTSSSANVAYSFPSPPISTVPGPPALSVPTPSTLSTSMTLVQNPLFHHASISLHGSTVDDLPATSFYEII